MSSLTPLLLPPVIGLVLNWWLYGILTMQYFVYLHSPNQDSRWLRAVVLALFLLDTAQTVMVTSDIISWFVRGFGDFAGLNRPNLVSVDGPFVDALIMLTVQFVYCWRLWLLGRRKIVPIIAASLTLISGASGMSSGAMDFLSNESQGLVGLVKPIITFAKVAWLLTSAITDALIAYSMVHLLLQYRTENSTRSTVAIVKRVLLLTLETNSITAALAIVLMMSLLVPPFADTGVYITLVYVIGKMYSNCFMVLLNQRTYHSAINRMNEETSTFGSASRGTRSFPRIGGLFRRWQGRNTDRISTIRFTEIASSQSRIDDLAEVDEGNSHRIEGHQTPKTVGCELV